MRKAIAEGRLIVEPATTLVGPSSIDLHLDAVDQARVWDAEALAHDNADYGVPPGELRIARMNYGTISRKYLKPPPQESSRNEEDRVFRRDDHVVLRPGGFLLWQTREVIGTPKDAPEFICFVDGKSTRARTGLVIHLTAPTIHAGWHGNVTLEMANFGPLDLVLHEGDSVAQVTVSRLTRPPEANMAQVGSKTLGQRDVTGRGG